jgi:hypothetical protein
VIGIGHFLQQVEWNSAHVDILALSILGAIKRSSLSAPHPGPAGHLEIDHLYLEHVMGGIAVKGGGLLLEDRLLRPEPEISLAGSG